MKTAFNKIKSDRRGNISMMFAISIGLSMFGLGCAVDFGRAVSARSDAQGALDAVVLAKAANPALTNSDLNAIFTRNFTARGATLASLNATADTSGIVSGTASVTVPMSFSGLFGVNSTNVGVNAKANPKAPAKYATVTMTITAAQGAYDKEIYAVTLDKNGAVLTRQLALTYDYTYANNKGTKVYSPAIGGSTTLSITSYDQFAIEMVVYEDTTYTGKKTNPKTLRSNASNASTFIKTSGACTDTAGQTQSWEDGGDSNYKDFVANMTCTLVPNSADNLRVSG